MNKMRKVLIYQKNVRNPEEQTQKCVYATRRKNKKKSHTNIIKEAIETPTRLFEKLDDSYKDN